MGSDVPEVLVKSSDVKSLTRRYHHARPPSNLLALWYSGGDVVAYPGRRELRYQPGRLSDSSRWSKRSGDHRSTRTKEEHSGGVLEKQWHPAESVGKYPTRISVIQCSLFQCECFPAAFTRLARRDNRPVILRLVRVVSTIFQAASAALISNA